MIFIPLILIWLCKIVWRVLLPMLWEAFMYNSFVFWTGFGAWIEPLRACEIEVFREAQSCLMISTIVVSENQLFLKLWWWEHARAYHHVHQGRLCLMSSMPMLRHIDDLTLTVWAWSCSLSMIVLSCMSMPVLEWLSTIMLNLSMPLLKLQWHICDFKWLF